MHANGHIRRTGVSSRAARSLAVCIILDVRIPALLQFTLALLLLGCNRAPQNNEAVRQGLMEHLNKGSGLDMNQIDVNLTDVQFEGAEARATVSFRPKSSPEQGMTMKYLLERKGDKWVVKRRADSAGHGLGGGSGAAGTEPLPPGHPPLSDGGKTQK